jgi:hypothetical protein
MGFWVKWKIWLFGFLVQRGLILSDSTLSFILLFICLKITNFECTITPVWYFLTALHINPISTLTICLSIFL